MSTLPAALVLRAIEPRDDATVAAIIRETLAEFGCHGPGFAHADPEVESMSAAYARPGTGYFVIERDGVVLGCGGFAALDGADPRERVAEVRKMYFRPALRGFGAGKTLLRHILECMAAQGYRRAYLETTTQMVAARALYERFGFVEVKGNCGSTGHFGCDRFFAKDLAASAD
jgi:putative acetyltransferase